MAAEESASVVEASEWREAHAASGIEGLGRGEWEEGGGGREVGGWWGVMEVGTNAMP